jgi:hypothetical protein
VVVEIVQVLCESDICQLFACFDVPKSHWYIPQALNAHFEINRHLHTARIDGYPVFHLGTTKEVAARLHCPFCIFVTGAIAIGSNVTGHEDLHVEWIKSHTKFELAIISQSGRASRSVLKLGIRIILCYEPDADESAIDWGRPTNCAGFDPERTKKWLLCCENKHKTECAPDPSKLWTPLHSPEKQEFRLIYIRRECIVSRP